MASLKFPKGTSVKLPKVTIPHVGKGSFGNVQPIQQPQVQQPQVQQPITSFPDQTVSLAQMPTIPQTPTFPSAPSNLNNSPALKTDPSNLEKFLDVINKPGAVERQGALNLINGQPFTQGMGDILGWNSNNSLLKNIGNTFSSNETYQPTGGDVLNALTGVTAQSPWYERVGTAVGGFAADVLNPADPLNWLGIGELTDTGRAIEKAPELAENIGRATGFFNPESYIQGNRALLSFTPPLASGLLHGPTDAILQTPQAVNEGFGNIAKGALQGINAIPGVSKLGEAFSRPFQALTSSANAATASASKTAGFFNDLASNVLQKVPVQKIADEAIPEIADGSLRLLNPQVSDLYQKMGYTPEQQFHQEFARAVEKNEPNVNFSDSTDEDLKEAALKVPTNGPTLPKIQKLADAFKEVRASTLAKAKSVGLKLPKQEGYFPQMFSDETTQAMKNIGVNPEKGSRVLNEFSTLQKEVMARDPALRAKMYQNIIGTQAINKNPSILDAIRSKDPIAANMYEDDKLNSFRRYVANTSNDIGTADVLGDMLQNQGIARFDKKDWDNPDPTGRVPEVAAIDIPERFEPVYNDVFKDRIKAERKAQIEASGKEVISGQKVTGETPHLEGKLPEPPKRVWVRSEVAKEMKRFLGTLDDPREMQRAIGSGEAGWRTLQQLYKKLTILTPAGGLHTLFRDHFGNHFQSWLADGWSSFGNAVAAKMTKIIQETKGNPTARAEALAKLGTEHGIDLRQALENIEKSNLLEEGQTHQLFPDKRFNKLETALGMKHIAHAREVSEQFSRIQHYMTRLSQGYSHEGALADTRKVLYDYSNLPPAIRSAQNFLPWVAWSYNNIPAMFEGALKNPAKAFAFNHLKQNIEGAQAGKPDERALDEYVKGDPHIRMWQDPKTGKWTYIRLKGFLPVADLEDVTSMEKFGDFMQSSLTPYLKAPLENTFNESLFFKTAGNQGAPIENYPGQTGSFLGMNLPRKEINILRNIRPLNELSKAIPGDTATNLNIPETAGQYSGLNFVPVDMQKATQHAQYAYQKQLENLKLGAKRQQQQGKPVSDIENLLANLQAQSYRPNQ
jgi:hypothetical protein